MKSQKLEVRSREVGKTENEKMELKPFPRDKVFSASAPCRIDSGGTWDIKAMALPYESTYPITVNIALSMRTTVVLSPFQKGKIEVRSEGFGTSEQYDAMAPSLTGKFAIFAAAARYMGFHGIRIGIASQAPVRSAMGGSSTALVACLHALSQAATEGGGIALRKKQILHLAYQIEDAVSGGGCGMQDHAAAVYGGVNKWTWQYSNISQPLLRKKLLSREGAMALSQRLLVVYSGSTHSSLRINRRWLQDFLFGKTTSGWMAANEKVHHFAQALEVQDWGGCARWLKEEMTIRREITPEALIEQTSLLIEQAEDIGCGARFAGAGAGGVVWAIGPKDKITKLKEVWAITLREIRGAKLLDCSVDRQGVRRQEGNVE